MILSKFRLYISKLIISTVDIGSFVAFWEHEIFMGLKSIKNLMLWVYYTIPFGFNLLYLNFQCFLLL